MLFWFLANGKWPKVGYFKRVLYNSIHVVMVSRGVEIITMVTHGVYDVMFPWKRVKAPSCLILP